MKQIVVITGAASGLGLSLSQKFLGLGAAVYGATKTRSHWSEAKRRLVRYSHFLLSQVDVTSEAEVRQFISGIVKKEGRIDILINNAGYASRPVPVDEENLREFQKNLSSNLVSAFLMCKHSIPVLRRQKEGWIFNVSSFAGKRAVPHLAAYSASKFGVVALTQSIAKENSDAGFKCVTVCPGGMNTEMRASLFGKEDAERQQSPDFVAEKIVEIVQGKIPIESGGDIVIRHSQITAINPLPKA